MTECNICHHGSDVIITDKPSGLKLCCNCATLLNVTLPQDLPFDRVIHSEHFHLYIRDNLFVKGFYTDKCIIRIPPRVLLPINDETLTQILVRVNGIYTKNQVCCGGCNQTIHPDWIGAWENHLPYCRSCRSSLATFGVRVEDGV